MVAKLLATFLLFLAVVGRKSIFYFSIAILTNLDHLTLCSFKLLRLLYPDLLFTANCATALKISGIVKQRLKSADYRYQVDRLKIDDFTHTFKFKGNFV